MTTVDTGGRGLIQFDNVATQFGPGQTTEVRNRYQWSLQFGPTAQLTGGTIGGAVGLNDNGTIGYYIKATDLPRVTVETQTLNQYNIRRNVNTHVSYEPLTMTFYDTQDNAFQKYLLAYTNFKSKNWSNANNVRAPFQLGSGYVPEFGMRSPITGFGQGGIIDGVNLGDLSLTQTSNDNFCSHIVIVKEMKGDGNTDKAQEITIYNPKIVDISQDQLDYADGSSVLTWTITWRYESYEYGPPRTTSLTAVGGLTGEAARAVQETGRSIGRFFENLARRIF
jgi:hypothetical protein